MPAQQATFTAAHVQRAVQVRRASSACAVLTAGLFSLMPTLASADGSWAASAPPVRGLMPDREAVSKPLSPPTQIPAGSRIHEVRWRFETVPDLAVRGRLCHTGNCIRVPVARGRSQAFAGLSADEPLQYRFALKPGQRPGGVVEGLQVIVNYQRPAP